MRPAPSPAAFMPQSVHTYVCVGKDVCKCVLSPSDPSRLIAAILQDMMERYNALRLAVETANDRQERVTYQQLSTRVVRQVRQQLAAGSTLLPPYGKFACACPHSRAITTEISSWWPPGCKKCSPLAFCRSASVPVQALRACWAQWQGLCCASRRRRGVPAEQQHRAWWQLVQGKGGQRAQ